MSTPNTSARSAGAARILPAAVLALCAIAVPGTANAGDPVLEWNEIARKLIVVPALSPVQQTRAMAIVQVAVHDAVTAVTGAYEQYRPSAPAPPGASPEAAAIGAAFGALTGVFGSSDSLGATYAASIATHGIAATDPGLAFGQSVGQHIAALRQHDGAALAAYSYLPPDAGEVGVWMPISAAAPAQSLLPGWGDVRPWVLHRASQFRPGPPPAVDSGRYARDYDEVAEIGALISPTRTAEQTNIALFWRASPTALWNPVLRQAIVSRQLNLAETARVMALFYLAAADASVACWEAKYWYNYWRPQAAIARGDVDGNPATSGNPAWQPLVMPTPPHPEYPSGHTVNSGAMAAILSLTFGDDPGFPIVATSPQNAGFVRQWQRFSEGVEEVIDARVYSGIHFRTADEVGARLGRQVARFVMTHALRPAKGS